MGQNPEDLDRCYDMHEGWDFRPIPFWGKVAMIAMLPFVLVLMLVMIPIDAVREKVSGLRH